MNPVRVRYLRRWYFAGLIVSLLILILVRYFVIGYTAPGSGSTFRTVTTQLVESLIAATIAGGFIAILLIWLFPSEDRTPEMELIEVRDIEPLVRAECNFAREWMVRARTASYFRARTLPWLAESAMSRNASIYLRIQVMDPTNEDLLAAYMRYLSAHEGTAKRWTADRVRNEIYATIVSVYLWRERCPRLEFEVGLSPAFWIVSMDISQRLALITGQRKNHPALSYRDGTSFYDTYLDEFEAGMQGCRLLDSSARVPALKRVGIATVESLLDKLGFDRSRLSRDSYQQIVQYVNRPEHQFA
jgi:hypothetical protein